MSTILTTFAVRIYLSGPIEAAKQILREECLERPLCVTIEPTLYIYEGGEEAGYVVGLLQYPRFPTAPEKIAERARELALRLLRDTHQRSALLVIDGDQTEWLKREDLA